MGLSPPPSSAECVYIPLAEGSLCRPSRFQYDYDVFLRDMDLSEDELDTAIERCNDIITSMEHTLLLFLGTQLLFVSGLLVGFMWALVELVPTMVITHHALAVVLLLVWAAVLYGLTMIYRMKYLRGLKAVEVLLHTHFSRKVQWRLIIGVVKFSAATPADVCTAATPGTGLAQSLPFPFRHHAVSWLEVRPHMQRGNAITPLIIGRPGDISPAKAQDHATEADTADGVGYHDGIDAALASTGAYDAATADHAADGLRALSDTEGDTYAPLLDSSGHQQQPRSHLVQGSNKGTVPDMQWRAVTLPPSLRPSLYVHPFFKHQRFVL